MACSICCTHNLVQGLILPPCCVSCDRGVPKPLAGSTMQQLLGTLALHKGMLSPIELTQVWRALERLQLPACPSSPRLHVIKSLESTKVKRRSCSQAGLSLFRPPLPRCRLWLAFTSWGCARPQPGLMSWSRLWRASERASHLGWKQRCGGFRPFVSMNVIFQFYLCSISLLRQTSFSTTRFDAVSAIVFFLVIALRHRHCAHSR